MTTSRSLFRAFIAAAISFSAGIAAAQHDVSVGGGSTKDVAVGESTSRGTVTRRAPARTSAPRRTRTSTPARRGTTAEQYNQQGDSLFEAKQYDDALEAYEKAVQLKPIAGAYYHIGWIYNDRDDYDQAVTALTHSNRLNPSDAVVLNELGYSYRNLKRYNEALDAYRRAIVLKPNYATPF